MSELDQNDLVRLVRSVFPRRDSDRVLAVLVDVPRDASRDNAAWRERRRLAAAWHAALKAGAADIPLEEIDLLAYPDTGSNNADLPGEAIRIEGRLPETADGLAAAGRAVPFADVFASTGIFIAPTEYSTTAPLKNAARVHGFRAATMPGFSSAMIPALRIDYGEVGRRVGLLKEKLDRASGARVVFVADGRDEHRMFFDLRKTSAHLSSGRFPDPGTAGNLPSGETYIVPFEGDGDDPSRTAGTLPVEIGGRLVLFRIAENVARDARGEEPAAAEERAHLEREPAYGNMAELGFGVLGDFGLKPIGEILLDEKLGLHVAFGRSDHFGGRVGPAAFSSPGEVIHLDRIYIPEAQPRIAVRSTTLEFPVGETENLMKDGRFLIF
jgi:hypothetical protein